MTDTLTLPEGYDPSRIFQMLDVLVERASKDERCPTADNFCYFGVKNPGETLRKMCECGIVRVEVSDKNYRTVWICQGQHRGKHTRLPPNPKAKPYYVAGAPRL